MMKHVSDKSRTPALQWPYIDAAIDYWIDAFQRTGLFLNVMKKRGERGAESKAPARSLVSIDDVGVAVAFLATDAAKLITGDTLYIDGGYHIID